MCSGIGRPLTVYSSQLSGAKVPSGAACSFDSPNTPKTRGSTAGVFFLLATAFSLDPLLLLHEFVLGDTQILGYLLLLGGQGWGVIDFAALRAIRLLGVDPGASVGLLVRFVFHLALPFELQLRGCLTGGHDQRRLRTLERRIERSRIAVNLGSEREDSAFRLLALFYA